MRWIVLVVVACGQPGPAALPQPGAVAPPGGAISAVALTEDGETAATADTANGLRLWPTLDGTREPIVVPLEISARQLAIGRTGRGYVVAAIDAASGVEVLALDARGELVARTQLPIEPPASQVVTLDGDVIVLRADSSLQRIAPDGRVLASLVAPAGSQIATLAARHHRAYAVAHGSRVVRRLDLADRGLRWSASIELPLAIDAPAALSPSGKLLVTVDATKRSGVAIQLGSRATIDPDHQIDPQFFPMALGFVDDDHVLFQTDRTEWWWLPRSSVNVPLQGESVHEHGDPCAIGDHLAIFSDHAGLELVEPRGVKHLGYRMLATGFAARPGRSDDELRLATEHGDDLVIDDDLREARDAGSRPYDEIVATGGDFTLFHRDPRSGRSTAVRTFERAYDSLFTITDPSLDGTSAVVTLFSDSIQRFLADPKAPPVVQRFAGELVTIDHAGTLYSIDDRMLVMTTRDKVVRLRPPIAIPRRERVRQARPNPTAPSIVTTRGTLPGISVSHDTRWIAILGTAELAVIDKAGAVRWRRPVPGLSARWTADDRRLIVVTAAGVIALDATSGEPRAHACAWRFGLALDRLPRTELASPSLCSAMR